MLYIGGYDTEDYYKDLYVYGMKQMQSLGTSDISAFEKENIVNFSMAKALNTYDPECGTNILTYFYSKEFD